MHPIIDMRLRPPYKSWKENLFSDDVIYGIETMSQKRGLSIAASAKEKSMELLLQEMEMWNVTGVVPVRKNWGNNTDENQDVFDLVNAYAERFIGVMHIDPLYHKEEAISIIESCKGNKRIHGVIIEPAWCTNTDVWYANDQRVYDIYERLEQASIPVLFTYGGRAMKQQEYGDPKYIDYLASDFPRLKIALCHGGWPYIQQACHVALMHENVYISADTHFMPFTFGYQDYVTAFNYLLQDKGLFASSYPTVSLQDSIGVYQQFLRPEVSEKIFYQNAIRFFGLDMLND